MANSVIQEPIRDVSLPENDPSNPNYSFDFDSLDFPPIDTDYLSNDLTLPDGLMSDFGFDVDFDFSFDDLCLPNENDGLGIVGGDGSEVLSSTVTTSSPASGSDQSLGTGVKVLNDLSTESGNCDRYCSGPVSSHDSGGCVAGVSEFLDSPSPNSAGNSISSAVPVPSEPVVVLDQKVESEEEGNYCSLKRKNENEDENFNSNPRSSKVRKSSIISQNSNSILDEDDKRKARLMRNRESAQLSRQRKKHYVEELEDKVRSMHSTIAELSSKVSFIMAENASLRQQLSGGGGGGGVAAPPGMYPPPPHMAPMPYPWIPYPSYPVRSQGSQIPLVPIPRLKPTQPVSAWKAKKSDKGKSKSKTKKVASISVLGLLFFMFLFGVLVPSVRENKEVGNSGLVINNGGLSGGQRGSVLTVNGSGHNLGVGLCNGDFHVSGDENLKYNGVCGGRTGSEVRQKVQGLGLERAGNSTEPLVASLFVPRNDKLVKIDGNLIIHSILASEKAKDNVHSANKGDETSLALPGGFGPSLVGEHTNMYRNTGEPQKALAPGSSGAYRDNSRSTVADRSLQKWFREGLAGPILSSGMCTEVFQFDISNPGLIPATSVANVSVDNGTYPAHNNKTRNRRILNHLPVPMVGVTVNKTEEQAAGPSQKGNFHGNNSVSSMVVSVLVDPREGGESESIDGVIRPKSLSRIFVVVLLDSVKYVTYSCVLPLKGSGPHLVTT